MFSAKKCDCSQGVLPLLYTSSKIYKLLLILWVKGRGGKVSRTAREAWKSKESCLALALTDWPPCNGSNVSAVTHRIIFIKCLQGMPACSHATHQTEVFTSIKSGMGPRAQHFHRAEQDAHSPPTSSCAFTTPSTRCRVSHCSFCFSFANADWTTRHSRQGLALDWKTASEGELLPPTHSPLLWISDSWCSCAFYFQLASGLGCRP